METAAANPLPVGLGRFSQLKNQSCVASVLMVVLGKDLEEGIVGMSGYVWRK
jgi:hypothetical protein